VPNRAENVEDPDERFIKVLQYYLAGWHIKPKGVKKPYNPVLGEFFRCRYEYPDGSRGFYIAEQSELTRNTDIHEAYILYSITSSTDLRILLYFTSEQAHDYR
jgi:hypothetical protein